MMVTKYFKDRIEKKNSLFRDSFALGRKDKDPILILRNIRKKYHQAHFDLDIVQLDFPDDQIHVIVGPNGSGKSTLLKIIALLEKPDRGNMRYINWDVSSGARMQAWYQKQIGFIMQNPYLFNMDVFENIALGLRLRKHPRKEIMTKVSHILKIFEIQHLSKRKVRDLSKGEYQKVAIAQILVLEPKIILMDEPMSNIDAQSTYIIEEAIKKIQKRIQSTVIMTTHSLNQAYRLSSDIVSLKDGRIVDFVHENVFKGEIQDFAGGLQTMRIAENVKILLSTAVKGKCYIAIDPEHIIISMNINKTSARNHFLGTVIKVELLGPNVRVLVDVGVPISSIITRQSFQEININLGSQVVLNFKVNSVSVI